MFLRPCMSTPISFTAQAVYHCGLIMLKTTGIGLSTLSLLHSVLFNDIAIHLKGIVIPVHCINPKATLTVAVLRAI